MATLSMRVADLNAISLGHCHNVFSFYTDWEQPALESRDSSVSTVTISGGSPIGGFRANAWRKIKPNIWISVSVRRYVHYLLWFELNRFVFRYSRRTLKRCWNRAGCALPRRCALGQSGSGEEWENSDSQYYILITNLMHRLLFIHKILYSSTCFEP